VVFSSYLFLFYFLPAFLLAYYAAPRRAKHLVLTLASYLFYGWANPLFVLILLASTVVDYIAALVMTTRISVKVMLAWSTCAQMGFMLMQCGLGVPEMALLHLLAHSLYKAHAFLAAGGVVRRVGIARLASAPAAPGVGAQR